MSNEEKDDIAHVTSNLGTAMMAIRELSTPIEEAARGYRGELIRDGGWSAQSADQMACEWYVLVMRHMQAAAGNGSLGTSESSG